MTKEDLLNKYGDLYIAEYYLGNINFKKNCINPIRLTDKTPSGRYYHTSKGRVNYVDFASPEHSFDIFKYVQVHFNLDFKEALERINNDLSTDKTFKPKLGKINPNDLIIKDKSKEFIIKHREFNDFDLKYWLKFNISEQILNYFNVKAVASYKTIHLDTNKITTSYKDLHYDPCYNYSFYHKRETYNKFYRPLTTNKSNKWRNNCNKEVIQGYEQLQFNTNTLFITSSLKDVMSLFSLGYEAVAPQSENVSISQDLINDFLYAYDYVIIFNDNDEAGRKATDNFYKHKRIKHLFTDKSDAKDISDYIYKYSVEVAKKYLKTSLKKLKKDI